MRIIEIKTSQYVGTNIAKAVGQKLSISCTESVEKAVDRLKLRHFPHAVTLKVNPTSEQNRTRLAKSITHLLVLK